MRLKLGHLTPTIYSITSDVSVSLTAQCQQITGMVVHLI